MRHNMDLGKFYCIFTFWCSFMCISCCNVSKTEETISSRVFSSSWKSAKMYLLCIYL